MNPLRGFFARLLAAAAVAATLLALVGLWAERDLLDSRRFASLAREALAASAVQRLLADEVAAVVLAHLPPLPAEQGLAVRREVATVVASEDFAAVFEKGVRRLHKRSLDRGRVRSTLDLSLTAPAVGDALARVDPRLRDRVPVAELRSVKVAPEDDFPDLAGARRVTAGLVPEALVASLVGFGLALALAPDRPRVLSGAGMGLAALSVALLILAAVAPDLAGTWIQDDRARGAAEEVLATLLRSLRWRAVAVAALGGVGFALGLAWTRRARTALLV